MGSIFSKAYDRVMKPVEQRRFGKIRKQLVSNQQGTILEIGSGTGANFSYYKNAEKVIAIEPDKSMRELSEKKRSEAAISIELIDATAERLPFEDNTFDVVVGTLVLCSVTDLDQALQEIKRVAKYEAPVLFLEHVRLDQPLVGKLQDVVTPIWKRMCDGCHLNRNTLESIKQNGFRVEQVDEHFKGLFLEIRARNEK
ncbi:MULTISPECIES: class I SAM-dependent methyltransferase [Allobacillus]|uniref:Class I SAM-dependent methyltransferase n=1 Tax=Allobacillus salarius TaxID=1955272 RepID=A0A556PBU0_9BACI|nr:class I SAM-dependent methyltransferase [Allobacillus salarius]TSJ61853.1 class I SAM-dependent methyltransferase [Allobacillus salarius]